MASTNTKNTLREKLMDDISELTVDLQELLRAGYKSSTINEDDILSKIDDIDSKGKMLEKFYELAEKLGIKIETIEDMLEKEAKKQFEQSQSKLGKVQLYEKKHNANDKQYKDHIKLYFNDISKIPLLSAEEEREIAMRVKRGDENAKKKLIESNLRLVISIAKRFFGSRLSFSDLIQEGNVGLIKAIEKFEPEKEFKFSTYATRWIKQSITKAIADMTKNVRIPVHLIDEINSYNKAYQELFQKLGREPTSKEIGQKLNFPIKKIKKLEEVIFGNVSLDSEVGDDGKDSLGDLIEDKNTLRPDQFVERETVRQN
ncbi:MAG TPA: sigma-70 family RNA polymerase sigma factor, partial [Candidatus Absconditabacterales bacterium]|nr:sigma-70 family RNA polymerase sigma factor [Candidatus Absconditabacterales bacterium]